LFLYYYYYYILVVGRISFRFLKLEGSPMILMQIFSFFPFSFKSKAFWLWDGFHFVFQSLRDLP
jgi:hypothetical protein